MKPSDTPTESKSPEKLCVFCKHLEYDAAGCGEYADPASLSCRKGHRLAGQGYGQYVYDVADFRAMILTAATCPDYTEAK